MATKKTNGSKAKTKETEKKTDPVATQPEATDKPQYRVPYISARIDRMVDFEGSKVKALASATIGNHFAVHGFKVIENDAGELSVLNPATKGTDGKYHEDFHAISKEGREALNGYILDAYEQKLEEIQAEEQGEDESEAIDEDQTAGPSMSQ